MSYFKNNNLFFSFIFALNLALVRSSGLTPNGLFSGYLMHIIDALPNGAPTLTLRCQDKNHDLGYQKINAPDEYRFKFRDQIFGGTLYFCHFWWNGKDKVFDVFNDNISGRCGSRGAFLSECFWKVQEDGFYFGPRQDGPFERKYEW
ncbi:S-protein homolog 5-like [Lycium barbarum]|uniref:S-protein homolog 5-like n=1 Tax=Lycium barbarum TaxID=112863 RepID=UPI00293F642B|nr:S-protein homolog 5-like [Lycium barbarum]